MVLIERDREKMRLGRHIERIAQVRAFREELQPEQLARFVFLSPELLRVILNTLDAHPDWDDETFAEHIDFEQYLTERPWPSALFLSSRRPKKALENDAPL